MANKKDALKVLLWLVQLYTAQRLTNGPDDSLLQLPLLVSFDDLCADVGAAVIGAGQLVVHTQTELPQQGVEHLQHGGACSQKVNHLTSSPLTYMTGCQHAPIFLKIYQ